MDLSVKLLLSLQVKAAHRNPQNEPSEFYISNIPIISSTVSLFLQHITTENYEEHVVALATK